jgi:hypothetical protein
MQFLGLQRFLRGVGGEAYLWVIYTDGGHNYALALRDLCAGSHAQVWGIIMECGMGISMGIITWTCVGTSKGHNYGVWGWAQVRGIIMNADVSSHGLT